MAETWEENQAGAPAGGDEAKRRVMARFEAWLDGVLDGEAPPAGLDGALLAELEGDAAAEGEVPPGCDLYAIWSAMTALGQEVRLEGRAVGRLNETLAPLAGLGAAVEALADAQGEALAESRRQSAQMQFARGERERELRREAQRPAIQILTDLYDRLERGLASARASLERMGQPVRGRFGFLRMSADIAWQAAEAARALEGGYVLGLERLTEGLAELGVRKVECQGRPFDPRWMNAADVSETTEAPEGTVLEVYRNGYTWHGEPLRPAQVRVARRPA